MSAVRRPSVLKLPHFLLRTKAKTLSSKYVRFGLVPLATTKLEIFSHSEQHLHGVSSKKRLNYKGNYIKLYTESCYCMFRITDCRCFRGKAAYTDVTHPLNPPPVRGTFVGTRKDIRIWNNVSVKLHVIAFMKITIYDLY